jgi:hypothetical protein
MRDRPKRLAASQARRAAGPCLYGSARIEPRLVHRADLSGYFDSIPHAELLRSVARRIVDRHMLHLIKAWLVAPVDDDDGKGGTSRSRANRDNKKGTPQGAPRSRHYCRICTCDGLSKVGGAWGLRSDGQPTS